MALTTSILRKIRHEIGDSFQTGTDDDATLETVFNDIDEGNSSVLVTALIVQRERLNNLITRSYDVTTEGSLLTRSQMIRMLERRIRELELVADETAVGINAQGAGSGTLVVSDGAEL